MTQTDQAPPHKGMDSGLKSLALSGAIWTGVRMGGMHVIRLASNLALTRLLFADAFGLMALVSAYIQGLAMFSDVGLGPSIVRSGRGDDPKFLHTAFSVQALRAALIFVVACAGAAFYADFYHEPALRWLVPLGALGTLIEGFKSLRAQTAGRHLALRALVRLDLISQGLAMASTVVLAFFFRAVWTLVAGWIVASVSRVVLSYTMLSGEKDRFAWEREALDELLSFGRWVFVSTAFTFLARALDRLLFGKLVPMATLGIYGVAVNLSALPMDFMSSIGTQVMFPVYSRVLNQGGHGQLQRLLPKLRRPLLISAGWLLACFIAAGAALVELLFDSRFRTAGKMVQLLALGTWFGVLEVTNSGALWALGKSKAATIGNVVKTVALLSLLPIGFKMGGIFGGITAVIAGEFLKYAVSAYQVQRYGLATFAQDGGLTLALLSTGAVGFALATWMADFHVLVRLVVVGGVVTALWLPALIPAVRALLKQRAQS
jgi:O-antigen/teichoic acid export membrane protein